MCPSSHADQFRERLSTASSYHLTRFKVCLAASATKPAKRSGSGRHLDNAAMLQAEAKHVDALRRRSCARRDSVPRSAMGIQSVAIERCSDLAEPLYAQLAPVREMVVSIPAPRCDHREYEDPTIAKQVLIGCRVVLTDFLGRMRDVELDRPAAACLEVYKEQPSL